MKKVQVTELLTAMENAVINGNSAEAERLTRMAIQMAIDPIVTLDEGLTKRNHNRGIIWSWRVVSTGSSHGCCSYESRHFYIGGEVRQEGIEATLLELLLALPRGISMILARPSSPPCLRQMALLSRLGHRRLSQSFYRCGSQISLTSSGFPVY